MDWSRGNVDGVDDSSDDGDGVVVDVIADYDGVKEIMDVDDVIKGWWWRWWWWWL